MTLPGYKHFASNSLLRRLTIIGLMAITCMLCAEAKINLALDSVAEWGRFPRFCVNTYRWGDRFFNTYDSAYVEGTGYKFNVKARSELWLDSYFFRMDDGYRMDFASPSDISGGFYLTYLAVSLGYDWNLNRLFGDSRTKRNKFNFKFNCALLSAEFYWITNDVGTHLRRYGTSGAMVSTNVPFNGINTSTFGLDAYYFFNNKRYSRAAAFTYSKNQKISQGSWFAGFSYWRQNFTFDFSSLPPNILGAIPSDWAANNYIFDTVSNNYTLRGGYGYNWVFARHWLLGVSESPSVGIRHGRTNGGTAKNTFSLYNRFQTSIVWSNRAWFAGLSGSAETGLVTDKTRALINGVYAFELSAGYRFNIW